MLNTLRFDLKKNILSLNFLLGVFALLVLMLLSSCTVFNGSVDQPNYNFIQFLIYADRKEVMSTFLYSDIHMFIRGFGGEWTAVFLPMLTGLVCVPMLCDELNSNNFRMIVTRRSSERYILSKLFSAVITAALVMLAAAVIFGLFCLAAFPSPQEYIDAGGEEIKYTRQAFAFSEYPLNALFGSRSRALVAVSRLLTVTLYSAVPCMLAVLMGALTLNKFISLSVPVMLYFTVRQLAIDAVQKAFERNEKSALWFFEVRNRLQYGEAQFGQETGLPAALFYIYPAVMLAIMGAVFYRLMKRRVSI